MAWLNRDGMMNPRQWTPDLSVGHDVLDGHHQTLFRLLADLTAGMAAMPDEAWARSIGDQLLAYMECHFSEEEALLEAVDYPFLQFHRASHQAISMRMHFLLDGLGLRPLIQVLTDVQNFLADWLSHHIEIEDFEYKPFLRTPD